MLNDQQIEVLVRRDQRVCHLEGQGGVDVVVHVPRDQQEPSSQVGRQACVDLRPVAGFDVRRIRQVLLNCLGFGRRFDDDDVHAGRSLSISTLLALTDLQI